MEKKHTVQRISNKKRVKPKVRFNFMIIVIIALLSFAICFVFYMIHANVSGDVLDDDDDDVIPQTTAAVTEVPAGEQQSGQPQDATQAPAVNADIAYPLPQSDAKDKDYFVNSALVTDSTLLSIGKSTDFTSVFGSSQLGAANCMTVTISSSCGNVTPYETMQIKKPQNLYIMLGSDLGTSDTDEMVSAYTTLVSNLHNYLPSMDIYVMQLPPAAASSQTVTNDMVNEYNSKLLTMARNLGVYCIDTNTALRGADGALDTDYWSEDDGQLNSKAYKKIAEYILTHTA
ncbi:MAG: hypothetical protein IKO47_10320 [Ruminococcus sp.]|nr:hypothetical protein [Ruminococcus sp.]